jgi:hypothetical protein
MKKSASDDSDDDFTQDLSEDSDGIVEDQEWPDRRVGDRATVHHFTGPDPGLIRVFAPNIIGDSSSLDFSGLKLTAELFSTILTKTNCYYQQHTQKEETKTVQTDITVYIVSYT